MDTIITTSQSTSIDAALQDGDTDKRPSTIPAVQEWNPGTEIFTLTSTSRILLDPVDAPQLQTTADVFADDVRLLLGFLPAIAVARHGLPGDILCSLTSTDETLGKDGYQLTTNDRITITARTCHGVFYGTRTVLQLLKQGPTIPGGIARDWPTYPERSLMVDVGRKYFSVQWLENHIRELAFLKYNYFHLHLSDNYGFRLECERHPEIVSPDHYTKEQIRALIAFAQRYHITIVPEIDMPGHMNTILKHHSNLQLESKTGVRQPGDIDLSKNESYALMKDILEEFIPLFPGPYWHIGADEYLMFDNYANYPQLQAYATQQYGPEANSKDTYLGFVNWANALVRAHGRTTRAWNDGLHGGSAVTVDNDIIYEHWLNSGLTPQEIVDRGLLTMNSSIDYLYYILNKMREQTRPDPLYDVYEQHIFQNKQTIEPGHAHLLGAKLHVWCDHPDAETENQIAEGIGPLLRGLAQKNWGSPKLVPAYTDFVHVMERIGRAPGYIGQTLPAEQIPHTAGKIAVAETITDN